MRGDTRRLVFIFGGIAAIVGIIIAIIVVARSGGDGGGTTGGPTPTATPLPPKEEGELRLFGPDPLTLDPALAADAGSARYIVEIFSGLVTLDKDTLQPVADMAESWDVSGDGTVYTFRLRRNVLFHDRSRQVTAHDFKYSMERALSRQTLSTVAEVYLGDIVGAEEFARGDAEEVTGIEVIGDFTLKITIDAAKPYFLAKLTYPTAFVVKREQVEGNPRGWTRSPIGTGAFRLEEWRLGERIVLVPSPQYYGDPKPALSKVTFLLAGGSPLTMYENDEVDVTGVGINDIERIRNPNEPLNREFRENRSLDTFYIGFNLEKPPFDDVNVRRAFAAAIDKQRLVEVVLNNLADVAKGILPPDMPGYNLNLAGLPFDPDQARGFLAQSKYGSSLPEIVLTSSGQGATAGPIVEAIVAMWEANLGVSVTVQQEGAALFFQDLDKGNYQFADAGWIADYVDPQNFLEIKFYSKNIGSTNETRYRNPQVDALLQQAQTEKDPAKRLSLYQQAEELIVNDAPWIPLFHGKNSALVKPYVQGYIIPALVIPTLKYVSISQ